MSKYKKFLIDMDNGLEEFKQSNLWIRITVLAIFFLYLYPLFNSWIFYTFVYQHPHYKGDLWAQFGYGPIYYLLMMPLAWGALFIILNGLAYRVVSDDRRMEVKIRIIKTAFWSIVASIYMYIWMAVILLLNWL